LLNKTRSASCRAGQGCGSYAASASGLLPESPSGFPQAQQCSDAPVIPLFFVIYCHFKASLFFNTTITGASGHWNRLRSGSQLLSLSFNEDKQPAPGAACWKNRRPAKALVASNLLRRRDPGAGFGSAAP
jgi:hypothetical protein